MYDIASVFPGVCEDGADAGGGAFPIRTTSSCLDGLELDALVGSVSDSKS